MGLVIILGALSAACLCIYQAIYVLRTGRTIWFFLTSTFRSSSVPRRSTRFRAALGYFIVGFGALVVLGIAFVGDAGDPYRGDVEHRAMETGRNVDKVAWASLFMVMGLALLARPEPMLRGLIRVIPEGSRRSFAIAITRLVGVGFLFTGIRILGLF